MGVLMYKTDRSMSPGNGSMSPPANGERGGIGSPTSQYKLEFEDLSKVTQRTIKGGLNLHQNGSRKDKKGNVIIKRKDAPLDAKNRKKCP